MEISFQDPSHVPLPPEETRIRSLTVEPWPDGRRVAVEVQITPFQQRPSLHISLYDAGGEEVAAMSAMMILQTQVGFTLHLRQPETKGRYTAVVRLAYPDPDQDLGVVDQTEAHFEIGRG